MRSSANPQKGQTIALVAVSMVSFVAMGALAIDLTSLYSARGEIQRAADAAALAGAKAFVDSGVTTDPGNSTLRTIALNTARSYAAAVASQNLVAHGNVQLAAGSPAVDFSLAGNPRITVTLQRTGLPLFFARIWGNNFASVSATAVAEAYNPAFSQTNGSSFIPSAPKCVKPILLPNNDPVQSGHPVFVNAATGQVNAGAGQFIGEQFTFTTACAPGGGKVKICNLPPAKGGVPGFQPPKAGQYLPMQVGSTHQYCQGASAQGCSAKASDFEQSVECCDGTPFNAPQCGTSSTIATWDQTIDARGTGVGGSPVSSGLQCLIHAQGNSQDSLDPSAFSAGNGPLLISPGAFSQIRYGLPPGANIATSDSIMTVPLFDNNAKSLPDNGQVQIVGFLTLFVNDANGNQGDFTATIMNVTGCGNSPGTSPPVSGGGVSSIPVRLIHN
jgi:hypothetical protein